MAHALLPPQFDEEYVLLDGAGTELTPDAKWTLETLDKIDEDHYRVCLAMWLRMGDEDSTEETDSDQFVWFKCRDRHFGTYTIPHFNAIWRAIGK